MIELTIAAAALAFAAWIAYSRIRKTAGSYLRQLMLPRRRAPKKDPLYMGLPFDRFTANNGKRGPIVGWFIKRPGSLSKGTVVLCHNHGANKEKMLPYARFLHHGGYDTLLFDYCNHGESGSDARIRNGLNRQGRDIECVVDHLVKTNKEIETTGIAVMGFSLGCVSSIHFANRSPLVRGVILDSGPPLRMDDIFRRWCKRMNAGLHFPYNVILPLLLKRIMGGHYSRAITNQVKKLSPRPVLFIHSDRDTIIPGSHTQELYRNHALQPKAYRLFPGGFHLTAHFSNPEEYERCILDFLSNKIFKRQGEHDECGRHRHRIDNDQSCHHETGKR